MAGMWANQGEHAGYAQQPNWNQWWDVGKSWDPNMEGYMWQAHPEWYHQQWSQWQHRAPPGLSSEELGQNEEDFNTTIAAQKDTPDPVALSLLAHLKQDVPEKVEDEDDDKALKGHIESAVASFLAGGDLEDSDEEEAPREETTITAEPPEAQLSADAGVFVPMAINIPAKHASQETSGPKCEYLISTLKRVGLKFDLDDVPTEKHVNNYLEYIKKQPLPPKLCEDEELWELFHQEIRAAIASSYFNRICPRLPEVQRAFTEHLPEGKTEELRADLIQTMCAQKTPGTYHILPPDGKGSQPIIFLAQTPSDFISFLDPAQSKGDEVPDADWNVFDEACKEDGFKLPHSLRLAAVQIRNTVKHFRQTPLAQVELLVHSAIRQAKLAPWDDHWRPKHVVEDLTFNQKERIAGMTAHQQKDKRWQYQSRHWRAGDRSDRWDSSNSWGKWEDQDWQEPEPEFDAQQTQWPSLGEAVDKPVQRSGWLVRPRGQTVWHDETSSLRSFSSSGQRVSVAEEAEVPEELTNKILQMMISHPNGISLSNLKQQAALIDFALWERDPGTNELVRMNRQVPQGKPKKQPKEVTSFQ